MFQDKNVLGAGQEGFTGSEGFKQLGELGKEGINLVDGILQSIGLGIPEVVKKGLLSANSEVFSVLGQYDKAIGDLQTKYFGGGREFANNIRAGMSAASDEVIKMGGKLSDVTEIMSDITSTLNTNFILQDETLADIYASSQLIAGSTAESAVMAEKLVGDFKTLGFSVFEIGENSAKILNYTKSLGVNTNAVYEQINKNVAALNTYNFSEGIYGMSKMAAQAAMLRIDMSSTLSIAEKLFKPEAAIEMSAAFQRLGVQVTDLLDPLTLMDISVNDPARLQNSIIEMTKSLTFFDEKNQKISILPGEQRRLRELAEALGMGTQELAKMAINAGEMEEKFKRFKVPEFVPEEQKESVKNLIANLGQLKDGKLMITVPGMTDMVDVSELNEEQLKALQKQAEDAGKSSQQLQIEANGALNSIMNDIKALRGAPLRAMASSPELTTFAGGKMTDFSESIKNFKEGTSDFLVKFRLITEEQSKIFKSGEYTKGFEKLYSETSLETSKINLDSVISKLDTLFKGDFMKEFKEIGNGIIEAIKDKLRGSSSSTITVRDFIKFPNENVITLPEDTIFGATTKGPEKFNEITNPQTTLNPTLPQIPLPTLSQTTSITKGEVSGTITLKIDAPTGMDLSKLQEYLNNPINMSNIAAQLNPILSNMKKNEMMAFS